MHACENEMVCESTNVKIPYFNAAIFLQNKTPIGKVDEILGPMNQVYFTIKPQEGIVSTSFKPGDKFYIGGDKLLPIERFLPQPKVAGVKKPKGSGARGGGRGTPRGRGGFGAGRGAPRGRGGFGASRGGSFAGGRGAPRGKQMSISQISCAHCSFRWKRWLYSPRARTRRILDCRNERYRPLCTYFLNHSIISTCKSKSRLHFLSSCTHSSLESNV